MAKLYFRYGAMNSGKTTNLLQVSYNFEERGMNTIIIKPKIDTKGEEYIVSRIGAKRKVDYLVSDDDNLFELIESHLEKEELKAVLVDEVQFLKKEQIDELMQVVVRDDIAVMCFGLRTDFKTNGFEGSSRLLEIAHSIEEMKTVCFCGKKAMFNARRVNGEFVFDGNQVEIDDNAKIEYLSLCPECYYKELDKYEKSKKQNQTKSLIKKR